MVYRLQCMESNNQRFRAVLDRRYFLMYSEKSRRDKRQIFQSIVSRRFFQFKALIKATIDCNIDCQIQIIAIRIHPFFDRSLLELKLFQSIDFKSQPMSHRLYKPPMEYGPYNMVNEPTYESLLKNIHDSVQSLNFRHVPALAKKRIDL